MKTEKLALVPFRVGKDGRLVINCGQGCRCFICLEYEAGRQAGIEEAGINLRAELSKFLERR